MSVHDENSSVVEEEVEEEVVEDAKDGDNSSTVDEEDVDDAEDSEEYIDGESSDYLYSDSYLFIPAEEQGSTMGRQTVARHKTVSRIDRWLANVTQASHDTLPAHPDPGIEGQLSYLRMRPSRLRQWRSDMAI
ncbi:hypothetical protein L198_08096 [Cryptococcus wingfieldii CBS 7118]|uniref:Uncharacterized protein n=1 Tax=Cryptococcus wingfieldii CBS 7118 TaxID=1295528 RepID=A0A1E3HJ82_9TREE|nr:hypothetical protein L198_08096 [Cryptococcus wingfieldii CBS 7118]ODN76412.1 hypothetical protein L198_08096 [Cryptococcus wingfieldii CBS 7118]